MGRNRGEKPDPLTASQSHGELGDIARVSAHRRRARVTQFIATLAQLLEMESTQQHNKKSLFPKATISQPHCTLSCFCSLRLVYISARVFLFAGRRMWVLRACENTGNNSSPAEPRQARGRRCNRCTKRCLAKRERCEMCCVRINWKL